MITDIQLIVIHNISLPPSTVRWRLYSTIFQNKLDWSIHPLFSKPLRACRSQPICLILENWEGHSVCKILMIALGMQGVQAI